MASFAGWSARVEGTVVNDSPGWPRSDTRESSRIPVQAPGPAQDAQLDEVIHVEIHSEAWRTERIRGRGPAGDGEATGAVPAERLEAGLARLTAVAGRALSRMAALPRSPSAVEMEFGLKVNAATGVVLAQAGTEAHLKVKLTWEGQTNRRQEDEEDEAAEADEADAGSQETAESRHGDGPGPEPDTSDSGTG
ncbi:CU044_2847 family protein [Streptomyces sp. NPDC102467]|uniref:CU044_2847 family protein n=1 Tax=Streptomyces sp. NPDC102467 TaxID=3366179 RepID=UPI00381EEA66